MRFSFGVLLLGAAALSACKGGEKGRTEAGGVGEGASAAPASSAAAAPEKKKALVREGSSIARAVTHEALYVADEDRGVVHEIALPLDVNNPPKAVKVPGQPAQVLALGDKVLVTIRSEGAPLPGLDLTPEERAKIEGTPLPESSASAAPKPKRALPPEKRAYEKPHTVAQATGAGLLLIMKRDPQAGLVIDKKVELPEDAWGIAVTQDESTALVTSAWTHKVSGVDLETGKVRFSLDVPREPRGVVVHPNGKSAYVTHLVGPHLTRIDGIDTESATTKKVELPVAPLRTPQLQKSSASLAYSATLSPDGKRLYVPRHALGATGPQVWMGVSTVDVLLTADDSPLAPARSDKPQERWAGLEAKFLVTDTNTGGDGPRMAPNPFSQPRAVVYRKSTDSLLIASEGTDAVVELMAKPLEPSMFSRGTHSLVIQPDEKLHISTGCGAPSGIALSDDEKTAWVFCRSTGTLAVLSFGHEGPRPFIQLGEEPLPAQAALGRRLFYNGSDELMSGGMGCAGCHPEGRDDGHTWHELAAVSDNANFFAGKSNIPFWPDAKDPKEPGGFPRQTPTLAGRVVYEGPYGWHAESPDLSRRLMNGFLLHRWGSQPMWDHESNEITARARALRQYLRLGLVPPPRKAREWTDDEKKGKEIFNRVDTKCAGCHVPESDYSDRAPYPVYSKLPPVKGFDEDPELAFKTPSLKFVGGTAPYAHDGRFATLEELIELNDDRMGNTKQLTKAERAALIAFLRTL